MWKALFDLALAAGDALAVYWLIRAFTSLRPSDRQRGCFLGITPLAQSLLAAALAGSRLQAPLQAALYSLSMLVWLRVKWRAATALGIVSWLIHAAATALGGWLPFAVAGTASLVLRHELLTAACAWCAVALLLLIARRLRRVGDRRLDIQAIRSFPWPLLAIFGLSLYNFLCSQQPLAPQAETNRITALALAAIGLWLFFNSYRSLNQSKENQELKFYLQTIETLTLELRQFRHNYRNILHGLSGYIENQEWGQLAAYFRDVVRETEQAELHSYALALKNVTNYALFGLLSEKLQYARQLGVETDLNVLGIFGQTGISATDLCQVVGIFLDNAVEAAQEVPGGKVTVTLRYDGSYQQIVISNDCARTPALSKANTGGYSTKGPGRGSGLYFAQRLLEKYEHVLHNTIYDDGEFRQELIIPVELSEN